MTADRWRRTKAILSSALEVEVSRRAEHVIAACGDDLIVRRDALAMLAGLDADDFLEQPPLGRPPLIPEGALAGRSATVTGPVEELRFTLVTPYTTLRVATRRTRYDIVVTAPFDRELLVSGGSRFEEFAFAHARSHESIAVGNPLRLEAGTWQVVTGHVTTIEVVG